jgi:hypothetical protein
MILWGGSELQIIPCTSRMAPKSFETLNSQVIVVVMTRDKLILSLSIVGMWSGNFREPAQTCTESRQFKRRFNFQTHDHFDRHVRQRQNSRKIKRDTVQKVRKPISAHFFGR